jgi:hypothetical protein
MEATGLEVIAATLTQARFPQKITAEVTAECNLACVMCHQPTMRRPKGVMPFELWRQVADEVAVESPMTECWFSGSGEPLLEPDLLLRMIGYGKSAGLRALHLNSNGVPAGQDLVERLLDSGVDVIVFGVDGYSKQVYESIRVGGDRDLVYGNIERLLRARQARSGGPEIQVQLIEMDRNRHETERFKSYWLDHGAVVKIRRQLSWGGRLASACDVPADRRIPCPWAMTLMHVLWDGRVARCAGDTEGDDWVGNAWQTSLVELWARLAPHRQLHMDRRFDEVPDRCRTCKDWMTGAAERTRPQERGSRRAALEVTTSGGER